MPFLCFSNFQPLTVMMTLLPISEKVETIRRKLLQAPTTTSTYLPTTRLIDSAFPPVLDELSTLLTKARISISTSLPTQSRTVLQAILLSLLPVLVSVIGLGSKMGKYLLTVFHHGCVNVGTLKIPT